MAETPPQTPLGKAEALRLGEALAFAAECHAEQSRKGTSIPYVSHLLQVAGLVIEHGGGVDQAIGGLLHDALEDCPGVTIEMIRGRFGDQAAKIVGDCSDLLPGDTPTDKSPWKVRKDLYLAHLQTAEPASVLVAACDKLHNLAALVNDVRDSGVEYLNRFSSRPAEQLWYFETILEVAGPRLPARLRQQMERLVAEFRELISGPDE